MTKCGPSGLSRVKLELGDGLFNVLPVLLLVQIVFIGACALEPLLSRSSRRETGDLSEPDTRAVTMSTPVRGHSCCFLRGGGIRQVLVKSEKVNVVRWASEVCSK